MEHPIQFCSLVLLCVSVWGKMSFEERDSAAKKKLLLGGWGCQWRRFRARGQGEAGERKTRAEEDGTKGKVLGKGSDPSSVSAEGLAQTRVDWKEGEDGRRGWETKVTRKKVVTGSAGKGQESDDASYSCPQHTSSLWMHPVLPVCLPLKKKKKPGRIAQLHDIVHG